MSLKTSQRGRIFLLIAGLGALHWINSCFKDTQAQLCHNEGPLLSISSQGGHFGPLIEHNRSIKEELTVFQRHSKGDWVGGGTWKVVGDDLFSLQKFVENSKKAIEALEERNHDAENNNLKKMPPNIHTIQIPPHNQVELSSLKDCCWCWFVV